MKAVRPRFSVSVYFYLVTFFLLLGSLPVILITTNGRGAVSLGSWIASIIWVGLIAGLYYYADKRCSSDRMRFSDGLLWVTHSMMTGWVYMSFIFAFPALLLAFTGSVILALSGDIRRAPDYSQTQWIRLVQFFYRNRMRQPSKK
jgi:hypothetical protein